jgi:hypothetical protein
VPVLANGDHIDTWLRAPAGHFDSWIKLGCFRFFSILESIIPPSPENLRNKHPKTAPERIVPLKALPTAELHQAVYDVLHLALGNAKFTREMLFGDTRLSHPCLILPKRRRIVDVQQAVFIPP